MTNEEKARQLIGCPCPMKIRDCEACFDRIKVLEMAAWKEEQMIEKAFDAYCKICGHYHHTTPKHICRQGCDYFRDFKKSMEGE